MFCEKCGKQLPEGSAFCDGCGTPISVSEPASDPAPVEEAPAGGAAVQAPVAPKAPLNKKAVIGIAVVAAAVLVIILAIVLIVNAGGDAPLLYVTDGELVNNVNIKKNTTNVIDDEYINSDMRSEYYAAGAAAQDLASNTAFTEDGKKFVYLADYDGDDESCSLFYVPVKALGDDDVDDEIVKVASGVSYFELASEASVMIYLKDSKLYYYNFKDDAVLVSKNVDSYEYAITADGKSICYVKSDDGDSDLYVYSVKGDESTKVDSGIYSVYSYDTDNGFKNILYSKYDEDDGTESLYRGGVDTDKEKLFSNAYTVLSANNDGYAFYCEQDDDYVVTLYCYNMESTEKTELCEDYGYIRFSNAKYGVVGYCEYDDDYEETWYVSVAGAEGVEVDGKITAGLVAGQGKTLYTIEADADADEDEGVLCSYTIGKDGLSERTKLEEDVDLDILRMVNDNLIFATDYDDADYTVTLYTWDGEAVKLGDEVYLYNIRTYGEDGVAFFSDPDDDAGTMYLFDGKKTTKVGADVYIFGWCEIDGDLYYLSDYDEDDGGTLYLFDGKDKTKIASDVQAIIPVN